MAAQTAVNKPKNNDLISTSHAARGRCRFRRQRLHPVYLKCINHNHSGAQPVLPGRNNQHFIARWTICSSAGVQPAWADATTELDPLILRFIFLVRWRRLDLEPRLGSASSRDAKLSYSHGPWSRSSRMSRFGRQLHPPLDLGRWSRRRGRPLFPFQLSLKPRRSRRPRPSLRKSAQHSSRSRLDVSVSALALGCRPFAPPMQKQCGPQHDPRAGPHGPGFGSTKETWRTSCHAKRRPMRK